MANTNLLFKHSPAFSYYFMSFKFVYECQNNLPSECVNSISRRHLYTNASSNVRQVTRRMANTIVLMRHNSLTPKEFNSYGSRRGNDAVMSRGTFANIRLINKMCPTAGPRTKHHPSGDVMDVFDAADRYAKENVPLIAVVGKDYGSGSSRDWAAKGPFLLGIRAVIAESFERIHRSNLVGMGIMPLEFLHGENADTLGLTGDEQYSIAVPSDLVPQQLLNVKVDNGKTFQVKVRFDTEVDLTYFKNGGILNYMIRKML